MSRTKSYSVDVRVGKNTQTVSVHATSRAEAKREVQRVFACEVLKIKLCHVIGRYTLR